MRGVRLWMAAIAVAPLVAGCCARRVTPTGRWEGTLVAHEAPLATVFDLREANARLDARVSFPDAAGLGFRMIATRLGPTRFRFETRHSGPRLVLDATLRGDSLLGEMHWQQLVARLALARRGPAAALPYREDTVTFEHQGVRLSGEILVPVTGGPHPAVVLIHGSHSPSRDDYWAFAEKFARNGVAALIYDKRGHDQWRSSSRSRHPARRTRSSRWTGPRPT
jgi:hypothetical protein